MKTACPFLPKIEAPLKVADLAQWRGRHDEESYRVRLCYGQSLWLEGKPAQAMLQLNRAFAADLDGSETALQAWPLPYEAMAWIMAKRDEGEFLGNPVRHFQHLATRMSGPRAALRTWRAWACFHLAEKVLEKQTHPRDEEQIAKEGLGLPESEEVVRRLRVLGLPGEAEMVAELLEPGRLQPTMRKAR